MNCYAVFLLYFIFYEQIQIYLMPCHFQCALKRHKLAGVLVPWDSMPEVLKFVSFFFRPLAIQPI